MTRAMALAGLEKWEECVQEYENLLRWSQDELTYSRCPGRDKGAWFAPGSRLQSTTSNQAATCRGIGLITHP